MKVLLVSLCGTMLAVGLRGQNVCCSCIRVVTAEKGVRTAWVLDAGKPVQATGLRFRADASRHYCRTPGAARVSAVENADGTGARRELARDDRLPPAFAGESSFLRWPATTSRYWLVEATKGGTDAVRAFGQYFDWVLPHTKTRWGIPCNGDAGTGNDCAPAAIELFDAEPEDFPRANAPTCAFPDYRLVKDWLMQDFGVEGAITNRPAEMQAYLARCHKRRSERLRRVAAECPRIVYVKHYTMGGDAELHGTALVTDEQVTGRPANFRKGGQLCLLTVRPDGTVTNEVLVSRPEGCIRDPDVSFDGRLVVFSMRSSFNENEYIRKCPHAGPGGPTRARGFPYDFYTKLEGDDYHLYTFDLETRELKQLTFSDPAPCADIEPCWTSQGEIIFQSSRCEQTIPCHQTQDVNLYVCRADGTHIRRLAIDGGCTSHPRELPDGRILYTRYEYNDRSARLQQPLFVMNPDGTQQQAYYGNASAFPASLMHFRPIPGSDEVMGILSGHHVHQQGKLVRIDRRKGTEDDAGIVFIAGSDILERGLTVPSDYAKDQRMVAEWYPDSIDFITQAGAQWQNPYPLSEQEWICGFLPEGTLAIKNSSRPGFGIYWQNARGERELLAWDATIECSQAVPACSRAKAFVRALPERNRKDPFGTFHIQDVYTGPGLAGIPRGTVKTLRVVAIENRPTYTYSCAMPAPVDGRYRPFLAYAGDHSGEAVTAGGAWDVKHVLGEVDVAADGSCTFRCPANNPVYFQLLDERGRCVQTMRSWTHLQPGEAASCVGCHEDKAQAYPPRVGQAAMKIQELRPARGQPAHPLLARLKKEGLYASAANYLGVNGPVDVRAEAETAGFSFPRLVQPILDRNCVKCHDGSEKNAKRPNLTGAWRKDFRPEAHRAFSHAYVALTKEGKQTVFCNWYSCMGRSAMLPPYAQGSATSLLMAYFDPVHHGVVATEDEKRVVQCWIDLAIPFVGSYCEATVWSDDDRKIYDYHQQKRVLFAQKEIRESHED